MDIPHPELNIDIDNVHANASLSNLDPFKFSHGLTGTNQPGNFFFVNILIGTALIPIILALCLRIANVVRNPRWTITAIASSRSQKQWRRDTYPRWGYLKRHFLYASAPESALVPSVGRPQLLALTVYIASNLAYSLAIIPHSQAQTLAELRARCGSLAALNLILTILFALRNNPLIYLLQVSSSTFNLFHRWTARLIVLQCTVHVAAFMCNAYSVTYRGREGWESVVWIIRQSRSYQWGVLGFSAFVFISWSSIAAVRSAAYDVFLALHRVGALVAVVGVCAHLAEHDLPQLPWMYLVLSIMVLEYFVRLGSVFLYNCSLTQRRWTTLSIEALPEEATRLRITVPQSWIIRPGSHIYLYVPRLAFWSSHPFSVAWSESEVTTPFTSDKYLSTNSLTEPELISTTLFCVIRARTGMTKALYHAASHPHHTKRLWCAIEGPYNSYYSLDSYGTVVFFAAGAGITHTLLFIRKILAGYEAGTVAAQKILLVWCIRHFNAVEWIRSWLEDLSEMPGYCEVFRVQLYVSGTTTPILPAGLLAGVDVRLQRCMPQDVIHEEALGQIGTMAVVACGPRGFAGSVREALIQQVEIGSIDFWEESAC